MLDHLLVPRAQWLVRISTTCVCAGTCVNEPVRACARMCVRQRSCVRVVKYRCMPPERSYTRACAHTVAHAHLRIRARARALVCVAPRTKRARAVPVEGWQTRMIRFDILWRRWYNLARRGYSRGHDNHRRICCKGCFCPLAVCVLRGVWRARHGARG